MRVRHRSPALYLKRFTKEMRFRLRPAPHSIPVFVFGQQRSGTTMLMSAFDWNDDCRVYEEGDPRVFENLRVPDLPKLAETLRRSGAPRNCLKPLCDSHRVDEFLRIFPDARCIWMFREHLAVSRSAVRRFPNAHLTLRAICERRPTASWFEEGLSPSTRQTLESVYRASLSARECACLIWWARNTIAIEQSLLGRAWFADYDELVRDKQAGFARLFRYLRLELDDKSTDFVHDTSSRTSDAIELDPQVAALCTNMLSELRALASRNIELLATV
jgi:hypothetical protein